MPLLPGHVLALRMRLSGLLSGRYARAQAECIWHHDATEYLPAYPKPASMWERWAFSPTAKECNAVVEPPWWERHGIADPASCTRQLQEIAALDGDGVWRLK